jgi:hypothetical protein
VVRGARAPGRRITSSAIHFEATRDPALLREAPEHRLQHEELRRGRGAACQIDGSTKRASGRTERQRYQDLLRLRTGPVLTPTSMLAGR